MDDGSGKYCCLWSRGYNVIHHVNATWLVAWSVLRGAPQSLVAMQVWFVAVAAVALVATAKDVPQACKHLEFSSWSDAGLRAYLLERGITSPGAPHDKLVTLAKNDCEALMAGVERGGDGIAAQRNQALSAASSVRASFASKTASTKSMPSATPVDTEPIKLGVSTAARKAGKSTSTVAEKRWDDVSAYLDDAKDYVYSKWSEVDLHGWLRTHGLDVPTNAARSTMLAMIREPFAREHYNRPYARLSSEYLHRWLVEHGYLQGESPPQSRETYEALAQRYYYYMKDRVYDTWTQADLHKWLADRGLVPQDWRATRDEYLRVMQDKYARAVDTIWAGWKESDMRQYLARKGVLTQASTYDEVLQLMQKHAQSAATTASAYVSWSDAKLRGFLKDRGVRVEALPSSRWELLRAMRAHYAPSWSVQWQQAFESALARVKRGGKSLLGVHDEL